MKAYFHWSWALAVVCLFLSAPLFSQAPGLTPFSPGQQPIGADATPRYQAIHSISGSTGETVTVQQVASGTKTLIYENAWVVCSVACTVKVSQNGTGATTTTLATSALNTSPPSTAKAFSASNVGTGVYVSGAYTLAAAGTVSIDLSRFYSTQNGGINQNLSIIVAGTTLTATTTIQWVEK